MLFSLENVTFGYNGVPVLKDVRLSLHENERVGFIGGNGEGKTTLLRLILGELVPDCGSVFRKNALRIGYLEQSGGLESALGVYDCMEEVFAEDKRLISRLHEAQNKLARAEAREMKAVSGEIEALEKRIAARDSYHFDVRIKTVLNGMGFGSVYGQSVATMSGGEKTRLKLCRLLLEEPELLILDEPTNHLDVKTLFWLEDYLTSYKGALFVVSHDRYFLDRLTTRTVELERGSVASYKGNYSKYKTLKAEELLRRQREYEKQQEEIARLQEYVDKNIVRATTAKSALSRVNRLERMELVEKPVPPPAPPRFTFSYEERPYEKVVSASRFDLKAEEKILLKDAEFTLMRGEKCALTGDNGTGKTTLLKFLLSKDPRVQTGKFVRISYYDQENADLNPEDRVLDAFWSKNSLTTQTEARKTLAQCGLSAEDVDKKVKELSGGLRAKLELALLQARRGNVLFLDEPTNHLDLPAREALEEALTNFDGTVLFVSHDRRFIEAVANRIVLLEDGSLTSYTGSYDDFLQSRTAPKPAPKEKESRQEHTSYRSREERAREAKQKARIKEIEKQLEALEAEEARLNDDLVQYAADYQRVREISTRLDELRSESDALYSEYEALI